MKCTREQEEIIFDIRLISDSRKAILRNQSFKLSFNKYSLVHTFETHRKLIYSVFKSKGFSRDNHARWVKNELHSAVQNVARISKFYLRSAYRKMSSVCFFFLGVIFSNDSRDKNKQYQQ